MKRTPQNNARVLNLHAPVVALTGSARQKADNIVAMFDEAGERIKREEQHCDMRETMGSKG